MNRALRVIRDAPLRDRNTLRVAATAPCLVEIGDRAAWAEFAASDQARAERLLVLGEGSNVLFAGDPSGVVVQLKMADITVCSDDGVTGVVRAEAGVRWHDLVEWTLAHGYEGLENLVLIPGHVGAAPVQNIGAYGTEVCEFIEAVEAHDREQGRAVRLPRAACAFGYRDSLFKRESERWIVTAVELRLPRQHALRLEYAGIREELAAMEVREPSARAVADAVTRLRRRKLPDPAVIGNAGSFFKNPIVPAEVAASLRQLHPALPVYPDHGGGECKLSAAWLIAACDWKGYRDGDAGIAAQHALVLVNHGGATGAELLALAERVAESVQSRFGLWLEPEPRIIGATW